MRIESVWIVSTDAPDEPEVVLGVFGASSEAAGFIEQIADDFPEAVWASPSTPSAGGLTIKQPGTPPDSVP